MTGRRWPLLPVSVLTGFEITSKRLKNKKILGLA